MWRTKLLFNYQWKRGIRTKCNTFFETGKQPFNRRNYWWSKVFLPNWHGANVSAIRADVWRQLPPPVKHPPIPTHAKTIRAVNGQNIPVLGRVEVPFQMQSKTYPYQTLIISELAYDAILGRDFLEKYRPKIDLRANILNLEDQPRPVRKFRERLGNSTTLCLFCSRTIEFSVATRIWTAIEPAVLSESFVPGLTGMINPRAD